MQAVHRYLLKSVTVEIFIANFDLAENKKKWTDRGNRTVTFPVCFSLEVGTISPNFSYIIKIWHF
jgi:hypothetical protein